MEAEKFLVRDIRNDPPPNKCSGLGLSSAFLTKSWS